MGDQPLLSASSSDDWTGSNPTLNVECLQEGLQPLSGSFQLAFEGEKSAPLPHNIDAKIIKTALEALKLISSVSVTRFVNNNGFNCFATFLSEQGNLPTIAIDNSELILLQFHVLVMFLHSMVINGANPHFLTRHSS